MQPSEEYLDMTFILRRLKEIVMNIDKNLLFPRRASWTDKQANVAIGG